MKKNFSRICLSVLALSLLSQGVSVLAQTEGTTTTTVEKTTVTTTKVSEETSTTTSEETTVETTTEETTTETTTEETTAAETTTATTAETTTATTAPVEEDEEEALRKVGGVLDTVVLPDGSVVFKVRLDSLAHNLYSSIRYKVIHKATGREVNNASLYFNDRDRSTLKNFNFQNNKYMQNLAADKLGAWNFKDDPNGIYELRITGLANSDYGKAYGMVDIRKEINLRHRPNTVASFERVDAKIDLSPTKNGNVNYKITLNSLVNKQTVGIRYRIVHKKTGRVADAGDLLFDNIDYSTLKSQKHVGENGYANVEAGTFYSIQWNNDSPSNYELQVFGSAKAFTHIYGIVNTKKNLPDPQPKPASQKEVYRLFHPTTKNYAYTTSTNERASLVKKGWKYEGVAWKTETTKGERVYRLYNGKYYFYTKNVTEYKNLTKKGWKPEGTAYRSYGPVRIMRLVNPKTKQYFYTRHTSERDKLVSRGWKSEGTAWFSQP